MATIKNFTYSDLVFENLLIAGFSKCIHCYSFKFEFEDFIEIHNLIIERYNEVSEDLDKRAKLAEPKEIKFENSEEEESYNLGLSRFRDNIIAYDHKNERILFYSSSLSVIGLWALCEKNLIRGVKHWNEKNGIIVSDSDLPEKWDQFKSFYSKIGIPLNSLLHFDDINECRILNNSLKHNEVVGKELSCFKNFSKLVGKNLSEVNFEIKKYSVGVYNFVQDLYEKIDPGP